MTLTYKYVKNLKYISLNIVYTHAFIKLNRIFDFGLRKSKIISMIFTIFTIRYLQNWIYSCSSYWFGEKYKIKNLQL